MNFQRKNKKTVGSVLKPGAATPAIEELHKRSRLLLNRPRHQIASSNKNNAKNAMF